MVTFMSEQTVSIGLRTGWLTDEEMARARGKSTRAQRDERQKRIGPPWTRDGRDVLYSIEGYKQWLASNARQAPPSSEARRPLGRPRKLELTA